MANSILTNSQAASALLRMNDTNMMLDKTQGRISSGMKVGSAKDNASTFAIAAGMRSDVAVFRTIKENVALGKAVVDSSLSAAEQIQTEIKTIKEKIAQAKDQPQGRSLVQGDIEASIAQIANFVNSATFNGINLIDGVGKAAGKTFSVTGALDRDANGTATLTSLNFSYYNLTTTDSAIGLGALKNMDVDRGDVFDNDTSAKTSATVTVSGPATAAGTATFTYTDASGTDRVLTSAIGSTDTATQAATAFYTAHADTLASLGFEVTDSGAGVITVARQDGSGNVFKSLDFVATGMSETTTENIKLDFSGKSLKLNDTIKINYTLNSVAKTIVLKVTESATAAGLGTDDDGNTVISLDIDDVGGAGVSAQGIATAVRTALNSSADFDTGGATATTDLGLSAAGTDGTLTISTAAAASPADFVTSASIDVDFSTLLQSADDAEAVLKSVLGGLGSASKRLESQATFVDEMIKSIDGNIGTLVDADMAEEAARLQSLQARQQLGLQALSIANQQPSLILQLFRG